MVSRSRAPVSKSRDLHDQVLEIATRVGLSPPNASELTVEEYLREWLALRELTIRSTTWVGYEGDVRRYIVPHVGDVRLLDLTTLHLEKMFAKLLKTGGHHGRPLARSTVRRVRGVMYTSLQDAVRHGYLFGNPAARARLPSPEPGERFQPTIWTVDQLRQFLENIRPHPMSRLIELTACTGLRRGEVLGLSWRNIELGRRQLVVSQQLINERGAGGGRTLRGPKRTPRAIALGTRAMTALREERKVQNENRLRATDWLGLKHDLVFTTDAGMPLNPEVVSQTFHILVLASGLPRIRFHDLRHTHASLLLLAGVPLHEVTQRLGHSDQWTTLTRYAHVLPILDDSAASLLEDLVREALTPKTAARSWSALHGGRSRGRSADA